MEDKQVHQCHYINHKKKKPDVGMSKGEKQTVILHTSPQNMLVLKIFNPNQIESAFATVFKNF